MKRKKLLLISIACSLLVVLAACTNLHSSQTANNEVVKTVGKDKMMTAEIASFKQLFQGNETNALVVYDLNKHKIFTIKSKAANSKYFVAGELSPDGNKILLGRNASADQRYAYSILNLKNNRLIDYETAAVSYTTEDESASAKSVIGFPGTGSWLNNQDIANMGVNTIIDSKTKKVYRAALPKGTTFAGFAVSSNQDKVGLFHVPINNAAPGTTVSTVSYSIYDKRGNLLETKDLGIKQNRDIAVGEMQKDFLIVNSYLSENNANTGNRKATASFVKLNDNRVISKAVSFSTYALDSQANYLAGISFQTKADKTIYKDMDGDWLVVYNSSGKKIKGWLNPIPKNTNIMFERVFWSHDSKNVYVLGVDYQDKFSTIWRGNLGGTAPIEEVLTLPYDSQFVGLNNQNALYLLVEKR